MNVAWPLPFHSPWDDLDLSYDKLSFPFGEYTQDPILLAKAHTMYLVTTHVTDDLPTKECFLATLKSSFECKKIIVNMEFLYGSDPSKSPPTGVLHALLELDSPMVGKDFFLQINNLLDPHMFNWLSITSKSLKNI